MSSSENSEQSCHAKYAHLLSDCDSVDSQILNLDEIGCLINHLDQFLHASHLNNAGVLVTRLSRNIITHGLVNAYEDGEEKNFDENDFQGIADSAVRCFSYLKLLLPKLTFLDDAEKRSFLIHSLMLCATHNKTFMWSNTESTVSCEEFLDELLTFMECKNLPNLLCCESFDPSLFQGILLTMKPHLTKNTWTKNPSSCHMFVWFLMNVKHPFLAEYLANVLPPSLMFIDHYTSESQAMGIQCLDHIICNVPPSHLKLHGQTDVIYNALSRLKYSKDCHVVDILYPCILKLMSVEGNDGRSSNIKLWTPFDDIYSQLLLNTQMEDNMKLRSTYLCHIRLYIAKLSPIKHLKHTMEVLSTNISIYHSPEETCRILSLGILKDIIKNCWPRMESHCEEILKIIMFLVYDIKTDRGTPVSDVKEDILSLCTECLLLLNDACPQTFQLLTKNLIKENDHIPGVDFLNTVVNLRKRSEACL